MSLDPKHMNHSRAKEPKKPKVGPGFKIYAIRNGDSIVRYHVVKDTGENTQFFKEPINRLPLDVLEGVERGVRRSHVKNGKKYDGKIDQDEQMMLDKLAFELKPDPFGRFVGDMPDGACGLNSYRVWKRNPRNTKIHYGYYVYQPYGDKDWYALEHFWIMKKDKKGTWRVIEHTGDEGKPAAKAMFVGRECSPDEAWTYAILHNHFSLWGEKPKEE